MSKDISRIDTVTPIKIEPVMDERLPLPQRDLSFQIKTTPDNSNIQRVESGSNNASILSFTFQTQSDNALIDKVMYIEAKIRLTFQAKSGNATAGGLPLINKQFAPRAFPLSTICNSMKLNINNSEVSINNYGNYIQALAHYNDSYDNMAYDLSGVPNYLDKHQKYDSSQNGTTSELESYSVAGVGGRTARGAWKIDSIVGNEAVNASDGATKITTLEFTVFEPIFISPFLKNDVESSIGNVRNMQLTMQFQNAERIISIEKQSGPVRTTENIVISEAKMEFVNKAHLNVKYITPPITLRIPPVLAYPFQDIRVEVQDLSDQMAPFDTLTKSFNAQQLGIVPKMIYVFVDRHNGNKTIHTTDTYLRIDSLKISYLNSSGQFSSYSHKDLYNMSVKNGLDVSYQEFNGESYLNNTLRDGSGNPQRTGTNYKGLTGSIVAISTSDLQLPSNIASGLSINGQFSLDITFTNITNEVNFQPSIKLIFVNEGVMEIGEGRMTQNLGVVDQEQIQIYTDQEINPAQRYVDSKLPLLGGGLFDSITKTLGNIGRKALDAGKSACDTLDQHHAMADALLPKSGGMLMGGQLVGGRMISKDRLKKNLLK